MKGLTVCSAALLLIAVSPTAARPSELLQVRIERKLAEAPRGTRFGLVVATRDGRELVAINPDGRFIPASNTKILTTAAAFDTLPELGAADVDGGTAVRLEPDGRGPPDVVIEGRGDARLSSAPDCVVNCLAMLADAVAARVRRVDDVIGDDRRFPDQRWSPGMSWNNMPLRSGTAISALTLDDNELPLRVIPSAPRVQPKIELSSYYSLDNQAMTVAQGKVELQVNRLPGSRQVRLTGTIAAGADTELLRLGIDDPAHYAAWRFRQMLEGRGVRVSGEVTVRHRPWAPADSPALRRGAPAALPSPLPPPLATLSPPPLVEDLSTVNKPSQNVHAELLLRRVGDWRGSGSVEDGVAAVHAMLDRAGISRAEIEVHDGSGMSSYNRVSPRGMIKFLRWIDTQPWGERWRMTLPVAGREGTLSGRFRGTALEGRLIAKTGTLHASHALSGRMLTRSGQTLLFAIYANDVPDDAKVTAVIDTLLVMIANEN